MYGHDVHTLEANKLAHEARANGWTSLNCHHPELSMWRLFGVPPERVKTPEKSEPSGRIGSPPPSGMEEITRLSTSLVSAVDAAEKHARENGWDGLVWCSNDEGHVLYGRRAVLVKSEFKHAMAEVRAALETVEAGLAWLKDGEAVAFSMGAYSPDWPQKPAAVVKAVADGWTGLRWVDDKDQGLFHLVGKRPADDRGHIALPIGDVPMLEAVQREHGMDGLRKREAKRSPDEPKSIDLARAWVMDAFNEWARNTHCTRREWDVICEDIRAALWGRAPKEAPPEPEQVTAPSDGPPRIRSELGGLMGPGYQATGYEPPPRRRVLLDDPTGDDIAGDVLP